MNAFNNVNQASACIVASIEIAVELGVPEENWIYPAGAAGFEERDECKLCTLSNLPARRWR
jgi:hypothetical protein